jgi:ubiquinone biosynthesis protein
MVTIAKRSQEIASILIKYGFQIAAEDLLPGMRARRRNQSTEPMKLSANKRICLAIQELGPTFIKFGQMMSTRNDLLSPELTEELKTLREKVKPVSWQEIEPTVEEYCGPISENFIYLNRRPFAAASLSQAYLGKLKDGSLVVLKVQRPGIREVIEADLRILKILSDKADKSSELELFNFPGMVSDFARQIAAELDFARDGRNADLLAMNMSGLKVRVPKVHWEYSGHRLLVMDYVKGVRPDEVEMLVRMGLDPREIALLNFRVYWKQIFEDGFFHGDPHPGNIRINREGELGLLDFGMVGVLRPEKREYLLRLILATYEKDVDGVLAALSLFGINVEEPLLNALKDDLYVSLVEIQKPKEKSSSDVNKAFDGVIETLKKYRIRLPEDLMLIIRVISMIQTTGFQMYPEFDFFTEAKPLMTESLKQKMLSVNLPKAGFEAVESIKSGLELPGSINLAFKQLSKEGMVHRIAKEDLEAIVSGWDRASYRLTTGLVFSSIILGMSLVLLASNSLLETQSMQALIFLYGVAALVCVISVVHIIRAKGTN